MLRAWKGLQHPSRPEWALKAEAKGRKHSEGAIQERREEEKPRKEATPRCSNRVHLYGLQDARWEIMFLHHLNCMLTFFFFFFCCTVRHVGS